MSANDDAKKSAYKSLKIKVRNKTEIKKRVKKARVLNISVDSHDDKGKDRKAVPSYRNFLFSLLILAFSVCLASPVILIPQHDGILFPEYWYELMITANLTYMLGWTLAMLMDIKNFLNMLSMINKWSYIRMFAIPALIFDILYCIIYFIWTYGLGYNYPIPFTTLIINIVSVIYIIVTWHQFPKDVRTNETERKQIKSFFLLYLFFASVIFQFLVVRKAFTKIPPNLQWIMSIVLPALRCLYEKIVNKLIKSAAGRDGMDLKANMCITINVNFSMFIAIAVGSITTEITSYCILCVEFTINMYSCIKIIRTHRKIKAQQLDSETLELQKREGVTLLALTEIVEVLAPMCYLLTFLIAYHGPNATILGNIKNGYWSFSAVEDATKVLKGIGLMFFFDCTFGMISGLMLWKFANLQMLKEYCVVLKDYWPIIAARLAFNATKVFKIIVYL